MSKAYALALLAAISLLGPLVEVLATGKIEPYSRFEMAEIFLSIAPIYWWYYVDKAQMNFRAGPIQNAGVIALAIVALPVYFIRSRGWKRGGLYILMMAGVLAVSLGLEELGEGIGTAIAS
jgi:hypothetical protein